MEQPTRTDAQRQRDADRLEELDRMVARWTKLRGRGQKTMECGDCGGTVWLEWADLDRGDGAYEETGCIDCAEAEIARLRLIVEAEEAA